MLPRDLNDMTPEQIRVKDTDYLLTTAARFGDKNQKRGLPTGFIVIVAEGDGGYTHHISDPDDEINWMGLVGSLETIKIGVINTQFEWEPVNPDGTELSEEEMKQYREDEEAE